MSDAQEFFLTEAVSHARTLPLKDAVAFLRGLLQCCGDTPETEHVRVAFIRLSESDRQLELIQSGQMKLTLQPKEAA